MPSTITPEALPALPEDLYSHLREIDPKSHYFLGEFATLKALAGEEGYLPPSHADIFPELRVMPPKGYKSEILIPMGAKLDVDEFKGKIHSLMSGVLMRETLVTDVRVLETDSGKQIRVCDLRPYMTSSVQKLSPTNAREVINMDRYVMRDLRTYAENDDQQFPNVVTGIKKGVVGYTRVGNSLGRAYYMPVKDELSDGVRTVARIADCRTKPHEKSVYDAVFNLTLNI